MGNSDAFSGAERSDANSIEHLFSMGYDSIGGFGAVPAQSDGVPRFQWTLETNNRPNIMNLTPLNLNSIDPFDGLRSFQREVSRLLDAATTRQSAGRFPLRNVQSDANVAVVTAEIPGAASEDLEITLVKGQLIIRGTIQDDLPEGEGVITHRKERVSGKFLRSVGLPFEVEEGGISATYENGVLEVTLPRAEKSKPRIIPIHIN